MTRSISESAKQRLRERKMREVRAGEIRPINDKKGAGHNSLITKKNKNMTVDHISITHSRTTRGRQNIPLNENVNSTKRSEKSYISSRVQNSDIATVGRKREDFYIKNAQDKAVVRNMKKRQKKGAGDR